jgi:hypothetical protein
MIGFGRFDRVPHDGDFAVVADYTPPTTHYE